MIRAALIAALVALAGPGLAQPLFPNSVVSNDIDFIRTSDPDAFHCLGYLGQHRAEMPDKRSNALMQDGVFTFRTQFRDGTYVDLFVSRAFKSRKAARRQAMKVVHPLGKLPTLMREALSHVVIHSGDETAFAEDQGQFFVLYAGNIDRRIKTHDLEETVFHETVHATLDAQHARSKAWRKAQRADGGYVTDYARRNPKREDLAESALFAYAHIVTPGRLPAAVAADLERVMPNRLAFFRKLIAQSAPLTQRLRPVAPCK